MIELSYKDARRFYEHDFKIYVQKDNEIIASGKKSDSGLEIYFSKASGCKFYIKRSKTHRFLKYLAGQVFIGYYLMASFGLLSLAFASLLILSFNGQSLYHLSPFVLGTALVSFSGHKIAKRARVRITKSLNKKAKRT